MKKILITGIIVCGIQLLGPSVAPAQGTTYVSNLSQGSAPGSKFAGSDVWVGAAFHTGTNTAGYVLNSVQLALNGALRSPSGFTVSIYTNLSLSLVRPKGWLGSLSGNSDPATAGLYTYAAASTITLLQNTFYHIVIMAGTPVNTGAYGWSLGTGPQSGIEGWSIGGAANSFNNGLSWSSSSQQPKFSINATAIAIPEPATLVLIFLGSGIVFRARRPGHVKRLPSLQ